MIDTLFLVAALTASPQNVPNTPTPAAPAVNVLVDEDQRSRQVEERDPRTGERPHTVGLGSQVSLSNRGAGGGGRFWLGERLGVNINVGWYRPRYTVSGVQPGSTFGAFPSFILMLTKPDSTRDIDVRPYVGGGISYVSGPQRVTTTSGATVFERTSGTGGQAFAGVELTFKEADWMTISGEGIYYRLPVRIVNSSVVDGFNYLMAIHFYLK
jgi:hypothetical protein